MKEHPFPDEPKPALEQTPRMHSGLASVVHGRATAAGAEGSATQAPSLYVVFEAKRCGIGD